MQQQIPEIRPRVVLTTLVPRYPRQPSSLASAPLRLEQITTDSDGREQVQDLPSLSASPLPPSSANATGPHCCSFHAFPQPGNVYDFLEGLPGQSSDISVLNKDYPLKICTACLADANRFIVVESVDHFLGQDDGRHSPYLFILERTHPRLQSNGRAANNYAEGENPAQFDTPSGKTAAFCLRVPKDNDTVGRCTSIDRVQILEELEECNGRLLWDRDHPALADITCAQMFAALRSLGFTPAEYAGRLAYLATVRLLVWCREHPRATSLATVDLAFQYSMHGDCLSQNALDGDGGGDRGDQDSPPALESSQSDANEVMEESKEDAEQEENAGMSLDPTKRLDSQNFTFDRETRPSPVAGEHPQVRVKGTDGEQRWVRQATLHPDDRQEVALAMDLTLAEFVRCDSIPAPHQSWDQATVTLRCTSDVMFDPDSNQPLVVEASAPINGPIESSWSAFLLKCPEIAEFLKQCVREGAANKLHQPKDDDITGRFKKGDLVQLRALTLGWRADIAGEVDQVRFMFARVHGVNEKKQPVEIFWIFTKSDLLFERKNLFEANTERVLAQNGFGEHSRAECAWPEAVPEHCIARKASSNEVGPISFCLIQIKSKLVLQAKK